MALMSEDSLAGAVGECSLRGLITPAERVQVSFAPAETNIHLLDLSPNRWIVRLINDFGKIEIKVDR